MSTLLLLQRTLYLDRPFSLGDRLNDELSNYLVKSGIYDTYACGFERRDTIM